MNIRLIQRKAFADRLDKHGLSALHYMESGGSEWLWGYFNHPTDESALSGIEIDLQDKQPRFELLSEYALNVKAWKSRHSADAGCGSEMVILGKTYKVREVYIDDFKTILKLGGDCTPAQPIGVASPYCFSEVCRLNAEC